MSLTPGDITARSEHTGLANAGEMGSECVPCARAAGVQFFYDDPLKTPITGLEVRLADASGEILVDGVETEAPLARGREDAMPGTGELRAELGGVQHGEVPVAAGALTATTNPSQDIPAVIEEAWHLEQDIVAGLEAFETSMKAKFQPYVDEWEREGFGGAAADLGEGVLRGIGNWWDGEKDFWGTAWGALKSSVTAVGDYIEEANEEGLPRWVPGASVINLGGKIGRDIGGAIVGLFQDEGVLDFIHELGGLMRAFLAGDIDRIIASLQQLTGLEDIGGTIGEFGKMIREALADGVDWMRDMIEVLRRTPVLNLMVNTAMRSLLLMTPNFWAKVLGEGIGFIVPELLIWLITTIIAALSAGAGATLLAGRCLRIASSIRNAIRGSRHVSKILSFLDEIRPIFDKIGDLAKKLRESIEEVGERIMDRTHRVVRSSRYWRQRLDDLARQGHGPQRHEGDVTDVQLYDRVHKGYDPMTGSTWDGARRAPNGERVPHRTGRHATKFNTPADYVRAYDAMLDHPNYRAFASGNANSVAIDIPMSDIFGSSFRTRIKGYSVVSGQAGQLPIVGATSFPSNTVVKGIFRRDASGNPYLLTMYPNF